jgi:inorganic pyrophosphatase/exopolyphosphatase
MIKRMKVITSGRGFLDIDAYACVIAYAELLRLQGIDAVAYSSAPLNESITITIRGWDVPFLHSYTPTTGDSFILVDVSEPQFIDSIVAIDKVEEVIDHHAGYETFWQEKIGEKAVIEHVGAACTQIYEKWVNAGLLDQISTSSAGLLVSGILDNTLYFKAHVTTDRDRMAYTNLMALSDLPDDWPVRYFSECAQDILINVTRALSNDTKMITSKSIHTQIGFGQLVIWHASQLIDTRLHEIAAFMNTSSADWLVNIVSIDEGKSYIICSNDTVGEWLMHLLNVHFDGHIAHADRLWLRKEIIKRDLEVTKSEQV